eukprot:g13098.t1
MLVRRCLSTKPNSSPPNANTINIFLSKLGLSKPKIVRTLLDGKGPRWQVRMKIQEIDVTEEHEVPAEAEKNAYAKVFEELQKHAVSGSVMLRKLDNLPLRCFQVNKVNVCVSNQSGKCRRWLRKHVIDPVQRDENVKHVIGLDTESRVVFKKPGEVTQPPRVSIIQIAAGSDVLIISVDQMRELPEEVSTMLTHPRILKAGVVVDSDIKAGVVVDSDIKAIQKQWRLNVDVPPNSVVDCSILAYQLGFSSQVGLKTLAAKRLSLDLTFKKKSLTLSDWSQWPLTPEQCTYAAGDACVSRELAVCLLRHQKEKLWDNVDQLVSWDLSCDCVANGISSTDISLQYPCSSELLPENFTQVTSILPGLQLMENDEIKFARAPGGAEEYEWGGAIPRGRSHTQQKRLERKGWKASLIVFDK